MPDENPSRKLTREELTNMNWAGINNAQSWLEERGIVTQAGLNQETMNPFLHVHTDVYETPIVVFERGIGKLTQEGIKMLLKQ